MEWLALGNKFWPLAASMHPMIVWQRRVSKFYINSMSALWRWMCGTQRLSRGSLLALNSKLEEQSLQQSLSLRIQSSALILEILRELIFAVVQDPDTLMVGWKIVFLFSIHIIPSKSALWNSNPDQAVKKLTSLPLRGCGGLKVDLHKNESDFTGHFYSSVEL